MENIKLLYIDLFCGAGGTSTGVEYARLYGDKCAKVIACVNHDPNAILSHKANHPDTLHFTEDIRTLELSGLVSHLQMMKQKHPSASVVLWASLECTNFSRAKGGQPRDADSRTLAEHLFRYIEAIAPDYIQIENVEEFMCWGELDENGKPVSRDQGSSYLRWVRNVRAYGYDFDWRILNAADFGAYTSRRRYFGQFARHGLPIAFPVPTYAKDGDPGLFNTYKRWKPVREVLDFSDEGESIFGRKKPLVEHTLERIYAGLIKFVAGGKEAFLVRYNSVRPQDTVTSVERPCGVLTTENRFGIARVSFISKQFGGKDHNVSAEQPAGAITTKDHHALVSAFLSTFYGNGSNVSVDKPCPTITTKDRVSHVTAYTFLDSQYGNGTPSSVECPSPAVTTNPKQGVVRCETVEDCFLLNPQYKSKGSSVNKPCFTLIARMDKMPPCLVTTERGELGIEFYESDSPMTVKIKEFMALYGIIDIKMRMLKIPELKKIMGFPEDYVLIGTQSEQKKFIGNAVEVNMSRVLCEALCSRLSANERVAV